MKCNLCENKKLFKKYFYIKTTKKNYDIMKCEKCNLVFTDSGANNEKMMKEYPEDYVAYSSFKKDTIQNAIMKFIYRNLFSYNFSFFKIILYPLNIFFRGIKISKKNKILDVGCGSGKFVMLAESFGMESYGIEPSAFAIKEAKKHGLKVFLGTLTENNLKEKKFDTITLHHVFEHIPNPNKALSKIKTLLKKEGTVILTVPNIDSLSFCLFRDNWVGFDVPRHLFFYSPDTLNKYAKKCGFSVEKLRFLTLPFYPLKSMSNFIAKNFKLNKNMNLEENIVLNFLFLPFCLFSVLAGKSDVVEIWLKRV